MLLGGGGKKPPLGKQHAEINSVRIQSSAYGKAIPIIYGTNRIAGNLLWYGDFQAITTTSSQSAGGKGGGGGSSRITQSSTDYYAALCFALCEGPIFGVGNIYKGKEIHTLSDLGLTLFSGTVPTQTPWGYLTTNHPGQDLGYEGLAYVAVSNSHLDQNANLPNYNYEIQGLLQYYSAATGQLADAEPATILYDILTSVQYGAGLSAAQIGSLTAYQQYCVANGFFLSPVLESQQQAVDVLKQWLEITNSGAIWSEGVLKVIPYGDQAITGNGMTFTPAITPLYTLTDDDYIYTEGDDPVQVSRSTPADAFNIIKIEFSNRSNNYTNEIAEAKDQNAINSFGQRPSSTYSYHEITSPSVARQVGQILLQRQLYKRNTYKFKVGWKYILLEPMDVIGLTESTLGITNYLVRITDVEEAENGELTITAEDMLIGTGAAAIYSSQTGSGYQTNYNVAPGNVNTPVIFEAPFLITAPRDGAEVWIVASGGVNWGGCEVWASTDNATYQKVGLITGVGRQGVLSATFPAGTDPDTTNTCSVDLTMSGGTLTSGTSADADQYDTLCYCDGELIAFSTATLTATSKYNLTTYIRRGLYGTGAVSHASGSQFARLDQATVKYYVPQDRINATIYLKFLSFNLFGSQKQSLASVSPYSFAPIGKNPPPTVTGFTAVQRAHTVYFGWTQVFDPGLKGYDIKYQAQGTPNWNTATLLTESSRGTESTTASIQPGAYTFMIRARDILDQLSTTITSVNLTVGNSINQTFNSTHGSGTFTVPTGVDTIIVELQGAGGKGVQNGNTPNAPGAASTFGMVGSAPSTQTLSQVAGGTMAARTYYVSIAWFGILYEGPSTTVTSIAISANNLCSVTNPSIGSPPNGATGWAVYIWTSNPTLVMQNTTVIPLSQSSWVEPTSGLIGGTRQPNGSSDYSGISSGGGSSGAAATGGAGGQVLVWPGQFLTSVLGTAISGFVAVGEDGANGVAGTNVPGGGSVYSGGGGQVSVAGQVGSGGEGIGSGGAASGGGGAGGYQRVWIPVKAGWVLPYTVGQGGGTGIAPLGGDGLIIISY